MEDERMKYNILIFDIYNLWFRSFWKNESLTKVEDKVTPLNAICKFFELFNSYIEKYGTHDCKCYYLFDNAMTSVMKNRKELDEEYKKNRKVQPSYFYDGLNMIELILKFYRDDSVIYRKSGLEADDFSMNILDKNIVSHDKVLMFSTDIDWCRGLRFDEKNDIVVNQYTNKNEILDVKSFEKKFGFKPTMTNIQFYKSFYGDESDNIIGALVNYPKQYFMDAIKNFNDMRDFLNAVLTDKLHYLDYGWKVNITQSYDRLMLNWKLVSFAEVSQLNMELWKTVCSYKPNKLLIIYNSLNVVGRFDSRVKNVQKESSIWDMFDGEQMGRA
jgi:5'-3' exonuclease